MFGCPVPPAPPPPTVIGYVAAETVKPSGATTGLGEEVYGESAIDAMASGAGSLLGLVGGITGAYKGARGIFGSQRAKDIGGKVVDATKTADDMILGGRGRSALRNVRDRADTFFDRQVGNIGYY